MRPDRIDLPESEVHLWTGAMSDGPSVSEFPERWLSLEEKERAGRYIGEDVRRAFIHWRGALRWAIGRYLGVEPGAVELEAGPRGKPRLKNAGSRLRFNLSHSSRAGVIALGLRFEIGVDIEFIRPISDLAGIIKRYFTSKEIDAVTNAAPPKRNEMFFTIWTRKEAVLKASGQGFGLPANRIETMRSPVVTELGKGLAVWHLHDLRLWPGYAGCVATEIPETEIKYFPLPAQDARP